MSNSLRAVLSLAAGILIAASPAVHAYWVTDGVAISTAVGNQQYIQAVSDGAGGAIVAWYDGRTTDDIYAQRVNASGVAQWTATGVAI